MTKGEFQCAACGGIFEKGWTDEEAEAEYDRIWRALVPADSERVTICDSCWKNGMEKLHGTYHA